MLLNSDAIIEELQNTKHNCDPLRIIPPPSIDEVRASGASSIDLRLGRWFLLLREAKTALLDISDPEGEEFDPITRTSFIPFLDKYILHPRKFVLGATLEWIRLPARIGGYVTGKSSWGRRGLVIETAAGIHPGFSGCLTLELANMGEVAIALIPGMPICQIFLHQTTGEDAMHTGQFFGRRRPTLGKLTMDPVLMKLRKPL
jgi:dCTP deaminase